MRCFFADGQTITRGFRFDNADFIRVGNMSIPIADSLTWSPSSRFGDYVIHCGVNKRTDGYVELTKSDTKNIALLCIDEPFHYGEKHCVTANDAIVHLAKVSQFFPHRATGWTRWNGLVQFSPGDSLTLLFESQERYAETYSQHFGLTKKSTRRVKRRIEYGYDGNTITATRESETDGFRGPKVAPPAAKSGETT